MAAPTVRADYEQLKEAANRFGGQAQAARQALQSLQRGLDVLQNGDWVGQGATAFYQEMSGSVLPTLKRLTSALERANGGRSFGRAFGLCEECTHFCKNAAASADGGPHKCGLTGDPLSVADTGKICVNHRA